MTLYRFDIHIDAAFATPPKGDTLFGQFCWQIVQKFGSEKLETLLSAYHQKPFAILSDILPQNSIKKAPISNSLFGVAFDPKKRKEIKAKNIIRIDALQNNSFKYNKNLIENHTEFETDYSADESIVVRNSISRLTDTTQKGFDPFSNYRYDYRKNEASFYLLIEEDQLSLQDAQTVLEQIGKTGFGKDATIGRGKFTISSVEKVAFNQPDANAMITLSPSILSGQNFTNAWYEVFTRFGKHGNYLAHSLVWKNPILMADSFALIQAPPTQYIGKGLGGDGNISKAMPKTVHQGYAITIPIILELEHETVSA
jgi:CRISPR-associated protein Csm4